jgi:hypothetical protein
LYDVVFTNDPVFAFQVIRISTGQVLFDSSLGGLTLADQFMQIGARLPDNAKVIGFGEHEQQSLVLDMNWQTLGECKRTLITSCSSSD